MKNIIKSALLVALALTVSVTTAAAQKAARINVQALVMAMPETTAMQTELETVQKDFAANLETMQVELNNKLQEYQQGQATMNASVKSLKEKDMQDLSQRMQQFEQSATQEIQKKQNELLQPILTKAREAIAKAAKEGGYQVVYDESAASLAYFDESTVIDLLPKVKTALGIK